MRTYDLYYEQAHTPPRVSELFARAQHWKTRAHEYKAHSRGPQNSHIGKTILQISCIGIYAIHTSTDAVVVNFTEVKILLFRSYRKFEQYFKFAKKHAVYKITHTPRSIALICHRRVSGSSP